LGEGLVGIVLAAGEGRRLRPLTTVRPKPLCPVGNRPLLDLAIERIRPYVSEIAVNAHHLADQIVEHLAGTDVRVSVEQPEALGTAGALGALREWIAGRDVLVHNGDAWLTDSLEGLVDGWRGEHPRLLVQRTVHLDRADFGDRRFVGASLLQGALAAALPAAPLGLYEAVWHEAWKRGEIEFVDALGPAIDCGTVDDYLRANLCSSGGASVIGARCVIEGEVRRSVVWDGCRVERGEVLVDSVRATPRLTVRTTGSRVEACEEGEGGTVPNLALSPSSDQSH
jgi:hypothetical protein